MAKSYFDLKSGFEQYLALAYGKHIVTGHPVEHAVGLDGNAASGVVSADSRLAMSAYSPVTFAWMPICSKAPEFTSS